MVTDYRDEEYFDGSIVKVCLLQVDTFWKSFYFILCITVFFGLPLGVLVILYTIIACHLMSNAGLAASTSHTANLRYRRQVVMMLGAVVVSFFIFLLPFRALTLCIIIAPPEYFSSLGIEAFYNILYFSRIMLYLNSAVNPILYNLMSSKFREGFRRLLHIRSKEGLNRKGTVTTTTLTTTNSARKSSSDNHLLKKSVVRVISLEEKRILDNGIATKINLIGHNGVIKADESYV
ncbi:hypothetical protein O3M35_012257 [Rhynocoris fuscipes]|uniref:G-protein coupled receptors family 1 profile domain-containing protein n=1 Tax=Rhynocoris fuscipes TaxID=488301 RepID=A0AAW1CVP5_9HEMI